MSGYSTEGHWRHAQRVSVGSLQPSGIAGVVTGTQHGDAAIPCRSMFEHCRVVERGMAFGSGVGYEPGMQFDVKQFVGVVLTVVLFAVGIMGARLLPASGLFQIVAGISVVAGFGVGYATIGWIFIPQ